MATLKDLQAAGYKVELSAEATAEHDAIYYVSGAGMSLYLTATDAAQAAAPATPAAAIAALDPKTATAADIVNAARGALTGAATTLPA